MRVTMAGMKFMGGADYICLDYKQISDIWRNYIQNYWWR